MVTSLSKSLISVFPGDEEISQIYTGVICEAVYLDYEEDRERIYRKIKDNSSYYLLNYAFDNTENIENYDGENTNEKYVLYCNEGNYKEKLESVAKSEIYNKTKSINV